LHSRTGAERLPIEVDRLAFRFNTLYIAGTILRAVVRANL
jgi:hypothetical protein